MTTAAPPIPDELWARMAELGPRWKENTSGNVKLMVEEFTRLHKKAPKDGVQVKKDIAYGAHARQKFDLFTPAAGGRGRPAVVFVHGGAFVEGDRNRTDEIYSNVTNYFARHGIVGANIGYRLGPEGRYPEANRGRGAGVHWMEASFVSCENDLENDLRVIHVYGGMSGSKSITTGTFNVHIKV